MGRLGDTVLVGGSSLLERHVTLKFSTNQRFNQKNRKNMELPKIVQNVKGAFFWVNGFLSCFFFFVQLDFETCPLVFISIQLKLQSFTLLEKVKHTS